MFEGKALGKAGDRTANAFIMGALASRRPDDAVLSEEEKSIAARLSASRVWIVDPLDGTREYDEGRTDWAVHVALSNDGVPGLGAVALPGQGVTLCTGTTPKAPRAAPYLPDLLVCPPHLVDEVMDALVRCRSSESDG